MNIITVLETVIYPLDVCRIITTYLHLDDLILGGMDISEGALRHRLSNYDKLRLHGCGLTEYEQDHLTCTILLTKVIPKTKSGKYTHYSMYLRSLILLHGEIDENSLTIECKDKRGEAIMYVLEHHQYIPPITLQYWLIAAVTAQCRDISDIIVDYLIRLKECGDYNAMFEAVAIPLIEHRSDLITELFHHYDLNSEFITEMLPWILKHRADSLLNHILAHPDMQGYHETITFTFIHVIRHNHAYIPTFIERGWYRGEDFEWYRQLCIHYAVPLPYYILILDACEIDEVTKTGLIRYYEQRLNLP